MLLEFFPTIGIDFKSFDEVNQLIHLIAQINSIQNAPECFKTLHPGVPRDEYDERVRVALMELPQVFSLSFTVDVPRWFEAYQVAQNAYDSMPKAVNHNELFFQQVGWVQRDNLRQLVIFDLETMSLSARFTDMAAMLGALAGYSRRDQFELFQIYYDKMTELNELEMGIDQAFHELKLVSMMGTFWSLPWYIDTLKDPAISETLGNTPAMAVTDLFHDLTALKYL